MAERKKYTVQPGADTKGGGGHGSRGGFQKPKDAKKTFLRLIRYVTSNKLMLLLVFACVVINALGNVIGSNVANILLILGLSGSIKPLTMGGITPLDMWMVVGSAGLLFLSALAIGQRRITRFEGVIYLAVYVAYVFILMK